MPNIKPISDLRNYTDVLKEVDISSRVYLTRNGRGNRRARLVKSNIYFE